MSVRSITRGPLVTHKDLIEAIKDLRSTVDRLNNLQMKQDLAANWTTSNPVLHDGQMGFETDTRKIKVGDGSTAWTGLSYIP